MRAGNNKNKRTDNRDRSLLQDDSEQGPKFDERGNKRRDYITLKNKITKTKIENEEDLLEYYTTEKFNEYFKILSTVKDTYSSHVQQQIKEMESMLQAGHNVCVFGRGSKIELLKQIHSKTLAEYHTFQVKAYLPSVTEKKIYTHFGGFLLNVEVAKKITSISIKDQLKEYDGVLSNSKSKVVILMHSIDGPNLMTADSQEKLADLFSLPNVQVFCSLDNIKMVMNWSPITLQKFKFLFFNIDTKQPYIEELKYRSLKNESRESTEQSLMYVWQSLNRNQKQIAKFIAQNALKNFGLDDIDSSYYTFNELLDLCVDQIVLSSDNQLRQNLLELLDHKVIMERTDQKRNKKIYVMKYEKRTLENILQLKIQ